MDVAFLAGEEEILEKFSHFNSDFVVSGEMCALHNMEKSSAVLQQYPGYFKEINVGLWIGKRTHAIEVLRYAIDTYRYHPDTHVHFGDFIFKQKRMKNTVTGTFPIALHYNGDKSRTTYFEMVKELTK